MPRLLLSTQDRPIELLFGIFSFNLDMLQSLADYLLAVLKLFFLANNFVKLLSEVDDKPSLHD